MANVIIALASAPVKAALQIIRLSGEGAFEMTDLVFSKKVSGITKKSVFFGKISNDEGTIDEVMLFAYPRPNTFTGEDVVEITCHGSLLIANEIIKSFLDKGATYANRGEFTSRAFYNGKTDLLEAEAINDLINATTKESKKLALLSLEGETSKLVQPLKESIGELLSLIEVNIDYPEYEDIEIANKKKIIKSIDAIRALVASLIKEGKEGNIIKDGLKVALAGEVNVGKSSLLNAMLNEEKAIVSPIPGTTRDVVEGEVNLKGISLHLLDTAGIRENPEEIEGLGINKSEETIKKADLVILVLDPEHRNKEEEERIEALCENKLLIKTFNKKDKGPIENPDRYPEISALNKDITPLLDVIYEKLGIDEKAFINPSLNNARQLGTLKRIDVALKQALDDATQEAPIDLISASLMVAYNGAKELLGETITQDLSDEIFSRFCVGK